MQGDNPQDQTDLPANLAPLPVLASVRAFEVRYNVPVVWARDPEEAGRLVERWACWFARDIIETARDLARPAKRIVRAAGLRSRLGSTENFAPRGPLSGKP